MPSTLSEIGGTAVALGTAAGCPSLTQSRRGLPPFSLLVVQYVLDGSRRRRSDVTVTVRAKPVENGENIPT